MGEIHYKALNDEIELVKKINKMEQNKIIEIFKIPPNYSKGKKIYAVHVQTKQESPIHKSKIHPKADVFLIATEDNINKEYLSDVEILCSLKYESIPGTGISVKQEGSKNYTLVKISPVPFKHIFGNAELGAAASLYIEPNDKNLNVIKGWGTDRSSLEEFLIKEGIISSIEFDLNSADSLKKIKEGAIEKIIEIIEGNKKLKDRLLWGIGIFREPYCAHFFYQDCKLSHKEDTEIKFSVTTGSGRSREDYTIVLKPKKVHQRKYEKLC